MLVCTLGCVTPIFSPTALAVWCAHNDTRSLPRRKSTAPQPSGWVYIGRVTKPFTMSAQKVVMVTGGTGLVGSAIKDVIDAEGNVEEKWVYLSSKGELDPKHSSMSISVSYDYAG